MSKSSKLPSNPVIENALTITYLTLYIQREKNIYTCLSILRLWFAWCDTCELRQDGAHVARQK